MAILFSVSKATLVLLGVICFIVTAESKILKCHQCADLEVNATSCPGDTTVECDTKKVETALCGRWIYNKEDDPETKYKRVDCTSDGAIPQEGKLDPHINFLYNRCATEEQLKYAIFTKHDFGANMKNVTEWCGCHGPLCNFLSVEEISVLTEEPEPIGPADPESSDAQKASFTSVIFLLCFTPGYF